MQLIFLTPGSIAAADANTGLTTQVSVAAVLLDMNTTLFFSLLTAPQALEEWIIKGAVVSTKTVANLKALPHGGSAVEDSACPCTPVRNPV